MAKDKTEAELRASLRRLVNGEPRRCIPANVDYDDDLILDIAISELIALRKTLPATLNNEGWSVTLTAPADCYVFMPRPGRLKVAAVLPRKVPSEDVLPGGRPAALSPARIGDAIRDAAAGVGYEAVSLADAGIRSIADVFGRIAVDAAGAKNRDYGDECTESAPSWEELAARGQRANKRLIDENKRLRAALAFAAAQIKAGLPWTPECEERIGAMLGGKGEG